MHSFYLFLWIFFIYSFLGWCLEVCFFALNTGKFVNRGFLNGPVCPIYGFGVVIVVLCLTPLMENTLLLFLGSVLLTSLLELGVGFALEKLFHQRWWDYTNEPFNLGGYICLRFSLAWGLACLLVMEIIHPSVLWLILHIPHTLGLVLLACFVSVMAVDLTATVRTIARINRSLGQIDELAGRIKALSNDLGENLADRVLDAAEKGGDFRESIQDLKEGMEDWSEDVDPETGLVPLGDMCISLERAIAQAKEFGHSTRREVGYLTIHSMLHLLGYDHLDEGPQKRQMRAREEAIASEIPGMSRD